MSYTRITPARVDSFYRWRDFRPALIVLAPPEQAGRGKFRVLEKIRLPNLDFAGQADEIGKVWLRYNVTDIAIDTTGHGLAVWEHVRKWFPMARKIEYSVASKTALVLKGQNVFRSQRIEFDAGWTDLMAALMAIRPALTGSKKGVTYIATRNGEVGHADIAWALLHALSNEPLDVGTAAEGTGGTVRFLD